MVVNEVVGGKEPFPMLFVKPHSGILGTPIIRSSRLACCTEICILFEGTAEHAAQETQSIVIIISSETRLRVYLRG